MFFRKIMIQPYDETIFIVFGGLISKEVVVNRIVICFWEVLQYILRYSTEETRWDDISRERVANYILFAIRPGYRSG